jgi:hypothetical protein
VVPLNFCARVVAWFAMSAGPTTAAPGAPPTHHKAGDVRVRAFIDFWNFQLAVNKWRPNFPLDWKKLGPWLALRAGDEFVAAGQAGNVRYEGLHVYMSHNPLATKDDGLRNWATNVLDRFPGVEVEMKERRPKDPPDCPVCHKPIPTCPHCASSMKRTTEKGIDTAIVTDMIRLAWENAWDLAVLVSADADFIPAVEFLNKKGRKVIHGGFPPKGMDLARKCWASFDITKNLHELSR